MPSAVPASNANRQITRAAGTIMVTFVIAKLAGLLRDMLMTHTFGASDPYSAYLAANRFSDTLFNLVAGGALSSAFIPTFTTLLTQEDRDSAWRLASAISNLVLLVLTGLGILSAIFAPWIVSHLLAPGFTDPAQLSLTVDLLRIQLVSAIIFGLSGLVMGILNAHQRFLMAALTPTLYQVGIIFGILVLAPYFGIYGVAWGVVIGAAMHLLVQLPQMLRLPDVHYTPSLGLHLPAVREVLLLMGPRLLGVAVVQLNFWVNNNMASRQPEDIVFITIAFTLMMMPEGAIAQSIATATLPTFSAQVARGKPEEMRHSLAATLRGVLLMSIPASLGLIMLRRPLVALLYQRGEFTAASTDMVAWALLWYAAGLVGHCIVEIVARAFYALHDTRTPVTVGVVAMLLNVAFSLAFYAWFQRIGLPPHGGLALANSLATGLEAAGLMILMRQRLKGLHGAEILRAAGAALAAALAMSAALWLWLRVGANQHNAILVLGAVALGGLIYGGLLIALRVEEVRQILTWVSTRLRLPSRA